MMTPYEKLKSLPQVKQCLNPTVTFEILDVIGQQLNDTQAATILQKARQYLLTTIHERTQNTG